jgi:glycosyltransferase involved in cell wall biosynthesis
MLAHQVPGIVAYPAGDRLAADLTLEEIVSRARQPGPLRLLFLGNVIPRKGLDLLLSSLARVPRDQWSLDVVGSLEMDPFYARSVKRLVKRYGFDNQVKFYGFMGKEDLRRVMSDSQVLVVPSEYEGFGIAYLEGMGFGLPAIATTGGGAGEIISHGDDGYLIPTGDQDQLVYHLNLIIGDRMLLARMSSAAREKYLQHPSWEQTTRKICSFLMELRQSRATR